MSNRMSPSELRRRIAIACSHGVWTLGRLARVLGISRSAVVYWNKNGVPSRWVADVIGALRKNA